MLQYCHVQLVVSQSFTVLCDAHTVTYSLCCVNMWSVVSSAAWSLLWINFLQQTVMYDVQAAFCKFVAVLFRVQAVTCES